MAIKPLPPFPGHERKSTTIAPSEQVRLLLQTEYGADQPTRLWRRQIRRHDEPVCGQLQ